MGVNVISLSQLYRTIDTDLLYDKLIDAKLRRQIYEDVTRPYDKGIMSYSEDTENMIYLELGCAINI